MKTRYKAQRMEIARRFELLNEMLGTTSAELCRAAHVYEPYPHYCDGTGTEAGSIPEREIKKICKTWEVSFEWLLAGKGEPFPGKDTKVPQHFYNVFEKQNNGLYKHLKTYKKRNNALTYIAKEKGGSAVREYVLVESDVEIKVYKPMFF